MLQLLALLGVFFCLLFAVFTITARSTFNSVFCLIVSFFFASLIFLLLSSDFICFVSIILYIGAVVVLFLFTIMMFEENAVMQEKSPSIQKMISIFFVVALFFSLSFMVIFNVPERANTSTEVMSYFAVDDFFNAIFSDHLISFECIGFALLAASLGSAMISFLSKREALKKFQNPYEQKIRSSYAKVVKVKFGLGIDYKNDSN